MPPTRQLNRRERRLVRDEVLRWHHRAWTVHAVSVMPDHVHILGTPLEGAPGEWYALPDIMQRVKGRSSRGINRLRGRRGTLWQKESYDRMMRGDREFHNKYNYILSNAGVADLIGPLEEYDGFWCEGMEGIPEGAKATPDRPICSRPLPGAVAQALACADTTDLGRPLRKPLRPGTLVKTRRSLPHWQLAGSSYFIVFCLSGRAGLVGQALACPGQRPPRAGRSGRL